MAAPRQSQSCPFINVLELYSGIGGMHWALNESEINFEVVMAVDINTTANNIYKRNFPTTPLHSFGIEKLTLKTMEKLEVDAILMSPPCQPFTRVGRKRDAEDIRTKSFLHVLDLIKQLKSKPTYILIENVKGFEVSLTHQLLLECLKLCNYTYQEFLLTPLQFGIPNSRLRYYLIAKWQKPFAFPVTTEIMTLMPSDFSQGHKRYIKRGSKDRPESSPDIAEPQSSTNTDRPTGSLSKKLTSSDLKVTSSSNLKFLNCTSTLQDGAECECDELNRKDMIFSNSSVGKENDDKGITSFPTTMESDMCENYLDIVNSGSSNKQNCEANLGEGKKRKAHELSSQSLFSQHQEANAALKSAGRNMRYCEDDDSLITEYTRVLSEFMEDGTEESFSHYLLTDKELKMFVVMDIVFPSLRKCTCFTKRYGHYVEGAGSVVQMTKNVQDVEAASRFKSEVVEKKNSAAWGEEELALLRKLKLRYFTPQEVANLLCFPKQFELPKDMSKVQLYRVLGNSLNVCVVAELIKLMVLDSV